MIDRLTFEMNLRSLLAVVKLMAARGIYINAIIKGIVTGLHVLIGRA